MIEVKNQLKISIFGVYAFAEIIYLYLWL